VRYIPHSKTDIQVMLEKVGAKSVDELFEQIPSALRFKGELNLPNAMSEAELAAHLEDLAGAAPAEGLSSFLGAGAYCHHVSPAVDQLLLRSEFYTAYTPYQPEVSQGTLQAIFEFQTMVCRILGMEVANASMYDGATAMTEAALMARRVKGREKIVVSAGVHPEYLETLVTYLKAADKGAPNLVIVDIDDRTGETPRAALEAVVDSETACVIVGYPNFFGVAERIDEIAKVASAAGALTVTSTSEPFAFGVLTPPGALGADISTCEGQALGVPVSFGGPGLGLFTIRNDKNLLRQIPGRLIGQTVDTKGETGYVLTLSTREQHIRREKATSNICSNQGLCALSVAINLSLLGKAGFKEVAQSCLARAEYLKKGIAAIPGLSLRFSGSTFNEFAIRAEGRKAAQILDGMEKKGFLAGVDLGRFSSRLADSFLVSVTECISREKLDGYLGALREVAGTKSA